MNAKYWLKTAPALLFFVGTFVAFVIRGQRDPELFLNVILFVLVPMIFIAVVAFWGVEFGRRAKSARTWQVMEQRHPNEIKYLLPVFPHTRKDLNRLGLPTRPAYLTFPMIGVVFGPEVTFWEEGKIGWSLRIAYSNIEAVELASTLNGARSWPAIRLLLVDHGDSADQVPRRGELVLSLQHQGHKRVSEDERTNLVRELNSRLVGV